MSVFFNEKALKKLRTADDMEQYVEIISPRIWMIVSACAALLIGLLAWAFFGTAATTLETRAVLLDGKLQSFLSDQEIRLVEPGDKVFINETPWFVAECSDVPLSRESAYTAIGRDYLYSLLVHSDKSYLVTYRPYQDDFLSEEVTGSGSLPVNVTVYTQAMHPIDLILNR